MLAATQRSGQPVHACLQILDVMGYPPSHYNKINIHIGGKHHFSHGFSLQPPALGHSQNPQHELVWLVCSQLALYQGVICAKCLLVLPCAQLS